MCFCAVAVCGFITVLNDQEWRVNEYAESVLRRSCESQHLLAELVSSKGNQACQIELC